MKKAFSYKEAQVWDTLPLDVKNFDLPNNIFKKKLRELLEEEDNRPLAHLKFFILFTCVFYLM